MLRFVVWVTWMRRSLLLLLKNPSPFLFCKMGVIMSSFEGCWEETIEIQPLKE